MNKSKQFKFWPGEIKTFEINQPQEYKNRAPQT